MLQIKSYYYENTFIILCMRQQKEKKKNICMHVVYVRKKFSSIDEGKIN